MVPGELLVWRDGAKRTVRIVLEEMPADPDEPQYNYGRLERPRFSPDGPIWDPKFATVAKWFESLFAGVYVGIADRAREEAFAAIGGGVAAAAAARTRRGVA